MIYSIEKNRKGMLQNWAATGLLAIVAILMLAACSQDGTSDYAVDWGPEVGSQAPLLAANDQNDTLQTLDTLSGPKGVLIVFNRSVDW